MQHVNKLTGILPGEEARLADEAATTLGTSTPELAIAAATQASISSTHNIGRESTAPKNTPGVVTQTRHDETSHHKAKPQDENMGSHQSLEADRRSIDAASASLMSSQGEDFQSELEHVQAKLKKEVALTRQLRGSIAQMEDKLKSSKATIGQQNGDIMHLREQIHLTSHNQNVEIQNQRVALEEKEQSISSLQEKVNRATAENRTLKVDLEDCKERIFVMQPFEGKSDTEIAALYESLCEIVTSLVTKVFDRMDDIGVTARGKAAVAARSVLQSGRPSEYGDKLSALTEANPSADEVMLSSVILRFLVREILFGSGFCFGVDQDSQGFVNRIMDTLSQLEPAKGKQSNHSIQLTLTTYRSSRHRDVACRHLSCVQCHPRC